MDPTMTDTPLAKPADAPVDPPVAAAAMAAAPARRASGWSAWMALGLAVLALLMGGLLWQKLSATQQEMARRSQESAALAAEARASAAQAEALAQELQARLAVAEVKLSEVTLQRSQLEELMLTLSRSRDDNLVQDIESALRLAQQQAELTGSAQPLLSALQAADQRIGRAAQPRLNPVQRAIARDIQRIQSATLTDVPSLVLRLDELAREVDNWPVVNEVGPLATQSGLSQRKADPAPRPVVTGAEAPAPAVEPSSAEPSGWLVQGRELWSRLWSDVGRSGRELVRVSRIDRPEAVLLAPEQAFFLRENLKLKLLNARLGLLARQTSAAQADVLAVEASLARYFDTGSVRVAGAQAALAQLRGELVQANLPRPEESMAALAAAAGGR
jgi:uroporphyrin-III C-methyltransferase